MNALLAASHSATSSTFVAGNALLLVVRLCRTADQATLRERSLSGWLYVPPPYQPAMALAAERTTHLRARP